VRPTYKKKKPKSNPKGQLQGLPLNRAVVDEKSLASTHHGSKPVVTLLTTVTRLIVGMVKREAIGAGKGGT
jgi:hypothetical protein